MRVSSDLQKLHDAVQYRLKRIGDCFATVFSRSVKDRNLVVTTCVLELDNTVISTLRQFTLSSLLRARTVLGHRVSINRKFQSQEEISAHILSVINSVRFQKLQSPASISRDKEPTVRDPKDTEKILLSCAASNIASLQSGLALNADLFRDLATVRNFYAHRNEDTWRKVQNKAASKGISSVYHPDDFVRAVLTGRTTTLFEDWLGEAKLFFEEVMK